jgi:hypothetical protein
VVERHLAKVNVARSNRVTRLNKNSMSINNLLAKSKVLIQKLLKELTNRDLSTLRKEIILKDRCFLFIVQGRVLMVDKSYSAIMLNQERLLNIMT